MTKTLLSDGKTDGISSKRLITFLAFLLCAAGFIANLVWGVKMDQGLFESMMYIVVAGLGFTASEQFAPRMNK